MRISTTRLVSVVVFFLIVNLVGLMLLAPPPYPGSGGPDSPMNTKEGFGKVDKFDKFEEFEEYDKFDKFDEVPQVVLVTQWYNEADSTRRTELMEAVAANLKNKAISEVHLLHEPGLNMNQLRLTLASRFNVHGSVILRKLVFWEVNRAGRLIIADAFDYVNTKWTDWRGRGPAGSQGTNETVVLVANTDISFDSTLQLLIADERLSRVASPRCAYFLSRHEKEPSTRHPSMCGRQYAGSHDTYVFTPPLPRALVLAAEVPIGAPGYENRLMYEFEQAGFTVANPCLSVKSFHHHDSRIKTNGNPPRVNTDGKSSYSRPGFHYRDSGDFLKDPVHFLDLGEVAAELRKKENNKKLCLVPTNLLPLVSHFCQPGRAYREGVSAWNCTHLPCSVLGNRRPHALKSTQRSFMYHCLKHSSLESVFEGHRRFGIHFDGRFDVDPDFFRELERVSGRRGDSPWIFSFLGESLANYAHAREPAVLSPFNWTVGYDHTVFEEQILPFLHGKIEEYTKPPQRLEHAGAPVLMLISNCHDRNNRLDYARELLKVIEVDSMGKCLKNKNISDVLPAEALGWGPRSQKTALLQKYPFVVGFENGNQPDYITEKLWEPLRWGSIPIYYGAPNVDDYLPHPSAIIKAELYRPEELAALLRNILADESLYQSYFEWRGKPSPKFLKIFKASTEFRQEESFGICQRMWDFY